jgi:Family of unknown function (DUF5996)
MPDKSASFGRLALLEPYRLAAVAPIGFETEGDTVTTQQHRTDAWPALRVDDWTPTRETLHMWLQIVGKIRLEHAPLLNHWWQVTLYVSPRGMTTSLIPYRSEAFDIHLDLIDRRRTRRLGSRLARGRSRPLVTAPTALARITSS